MQWLRETERLLAEVTKAQSEMNAHLVAVTYLPALRKHLSDLPAGRSEETAFERQVIQGLIRELTFNTSDSPTNIYDSPSWEDLGIYPEHFVEADGGEREAFIPSHYEQGSVITGQRGKDTITITMDVEDVQKELHFARTGDTVYEEVEWAAHWHSASTAAFLAEDNMDEKFRAGFHQPAPDWVIGYVDRKLEEMPADELVGKVLFWYGVAEPDTKGELRYMLMYLYHYIDLDMDAEVAIWRKCHRWIEDATMMFLFEEAIDWHERCGSPQGEDEAIQAERFTSQFFKDLEAQLIGDKEAAIKSGSKPWSASPAYNLTRIQAIANGLSNEEVRKVSWAAFQDEQRRDRVNYEHPVHKPATFGHIVPEALDIKRGVRCANGAWVAWRTLPKLADKIAWPQGLKERATQMMQSLGIAA